MNTNLLLPLRTVLAAAMAALLFTLPAHAAEQAYSDIPLFWATGVQPNVALLIDNSISMSEQDTGGSGTFHSVCDGDGVTTGTVMTKPLSRIDAVQEAACQVVADNNDSMRIALYRFNGGSTGTGFQLQSWKLNNQTNLKASIKSINNDQYTPLSSAMKFVDADYASNVAGVSPMQYRCQKNYTVLFTDGLPNTSQDTNATLSLPALATAQTSTWTGANATASPGWDGFADPSITAAIAGGPGYYYPWLDEISQWAYDVDMKKAASAVGVTPAFCGTGTSTTAGTAGRDCAGVSWDDAAYPKQNVVTYTVGFGQEADNEMMRDTPLVNQITVTPSMVDVVNDTITITNHGLHTGDYVHYYAPTSGTGLSGTPAICGYVNDTPPSSVPNPPTELPACGKYYVDVVNADKIKLRAIRGGGKLQTAAIFNSNNSGTTPITSTALSEMITVANHGLTLGEKVQYNCYSPGCAIPGLTPGNFYYAAVKTASAFRLSPLANGTAGATNCAIPANGAAAVATYCIDIGLPTANGVAEVFTSQVTGSQIDITSAGTANSTLSTGPGRSYFAQSAAALSDALNSAFASIKADTLSQASLAVNNSALGTNVFVYQTSFFTGDWSGDLMAFLIDPITGVPSTLPTWKASTNYSPTRTLLTWKPGTNTGVTFSTTNLTSSQLTSLGPDATTQTAVASWVQGNDGTLRARANKYGDILNGSPVYVGQPNHQPNYDTILPATDPGKGSYTSFKATPRTAMIYVGANDGMLHGFDAGTNSATWGDEFVGFIPNGVYTDWKDLNDDGVLNGAEVQINKFNELAQTGYGAVSDQPHRYFVDGAPYSGDAYFTTAKAGIAAGNWHTVVVGGLGKGGRSVYALDVTKPNVAAGTTAFSASNVLWEFGAGSSGCSGACMGYSYSRPVISRVQLASGAQAYVAIFGNGYDSGGDVSNLFILNIETGAVIRQITAAPGKGLSSVTVKEDATGTAQTVYAGDLNGTVWRFDLSNTDPTLWSGAALFVANDGATPTPNPQPITSAITLGANSTTGNGVMLYFGTGAYFRDGDRNYTTSTLPIQDTLYALWDSTVTPAAPTTITKSQLQNQTLTGTSPRTASSNPVTYTGTGVGSRGWYMNLVVGSTYQGERVVFSPLLVNKVLYWVSVIPNNTDPCTGGGTSFLYGVNALTGSAGAIFDVNGDGTFDTISGIQSSSGVFSAPVFIADYDATTGAAKTTGNILVSTSSANILKIPTDSCPGCGGGPPFNGLDLKTGRMTWRQLQ